MYCIGSGIYIKLRHGLFTYLFDFRKGQIVDRWNKKVKPYKEAAEILKELHAEGYAIAVASRTGEINGANQLLNLYDWDKYITYKEIYPGSKINHFER